jgi:hypothetical protein
MRKEVDEIEADPEDPYEYIDMIFLAVDGLRRQGFTPSDVCSLLRMKLSVNQERTWPDWRTADPDKAIEHVR